MMLALIDMRGNLIAAAALLVIGAVVLRLVRPTSASTGPRRWLPIVAFLAGPLVAFLWSFADVVWLHPDAYLTFAEYFETLIRVLILGMLVGTAGAAALWVGERFLLRHRNR